MSCEEEEESSMDEDEDMPGLESVSSSEYVSDEDSVAPSSDGEDELTPSPPVDPKSPNYITAQKWLNQNRDHVLKQIHVITVHMLSPFLYGCSHQSDKWLGWCFKVGLLQSDVNYNTGTLKDVELCAVYVLDRATEWCKEQVTKEGVSPENLAELLQLAKAVRPISKLPRAIHIARKNSVFISMLRSVEEMTGKTSSDTVQDPLFIETACLYVIAQTAEHVDNVINESINIVKEHEEYCHTDDMKYDSMMTKGDELKEQGRIKDCIAQYTTTVNLCPYNYKLYTSRAHCYITTNQHRAAMADGLRAVYLKPGWSKGHLRYIQGLDGCGMTEKATLARKRYAQLFPGQSDDVRTISELAERSEPTAADRIVFDDIMRMCKRASLSYQDDNLTNTTYWYEEVWQKIKKNTGWKRCMELGECDRFLVSLHYIYGSALLGRNETVSAETSLPHFESIMTDFTSIKFPGAYYGAGRAYTFLRQHSDAVAMAKLGLEMVTMSSACPLLYYPGTETVIEESKPDVVEVKLQKLLQQCKITAIPDAVCRYTNCLSNNSSSRIWSYHQDYRGHVTLDCNQDCTISYHPSCWRKSKTCSELNTDKDFLLTSCPTPDCSGIIRLVVVYDNKGAVKAKFEAPAEALSKKSSKNTKQPLPSSSSSSSLSTLGKRSEKTRRRKHTEKENDKPSPVTEDSKPLAKEVKKPDSSKSEGVKVDKGKERGEGVKVDKGKERGEGVKVDKGKERSEGVKVDKGKEKSEGVKVDKGKEKSEDVKEKEKSEDVKGKEKSEGVKGKEKSEDVKVKEEKSEGVKGKEKSNGVKEKSEDKKEEKTEDARRAEDSLAVIDRQREAESQDAGAQKAKKKKVKKAAGVGGGGASGGGEKHWNELFTLPEREGMVGENAARSTDEMWRPDPQAPFQTPSHLREAVQEFERSQAPSIGLRPNTIPAVSDTQRQDQSSEDLEFIYSFFAEIFKTHGPLKPTDSTLSESLSLLPEEKKLLIAGAGGIETFLLQSPTFCSHEGLICLSEDSPLVAESVTHQPSSASSSEVAPLPDQDRSSSSSTASGISPRDTPTDSPHIQKKVVDKSVKPNKKNKAKSFKNGINGSRIPVVVGSSSRVDKLENGVSLLPGGVCKTSDQSGPVHRAVQTDRVLMCNQWVMTDPIPSTENFKERYEMVLREKIDLRAKLEESEDRRFKMQRDHKRELERLSKTVRHEAKEEAQVKIRELDGRVKEEKDRVLQEKKDQAEQMKSHKAEIKSLSDKVERLKKEISKRDQQLDSLHLQHQTDIERMSSERRKMDERLRLAQDNTHLAMQRAITAEVDLLQLRVENVMRPGEARLMEIDRICGHIPPNNDLHREWLAYQEKLRTALECFQMATEEQIQAVRSGRELSSMEKIPNPSVPLPAHLAFRGVPMVRPPFAPSPMRMPMRGPPLPMGVRPMEPSMGFPAPTTVPATLPGALPPHPMHHPQPHRMEAPVTVAAALPQSQTGQEPPTTSNPSQPPPHPTQSPQPPAPDGGSAEGEPRGSKSSFDRIVEKLVPHYPSYSREDFKLILREVRRNNRNTLSGLSLDSIADQVRNIIEARERAKGGGDTKVKPRPPLPPVAQAPPPVHTSMEYTEEWSCVICYEDMDATDSSRLVCGHRFHTECIKSWFKEQNTCPTCRNYALLPDEYPFLGQ